MGQSDETIRVQFLVETQDAIAKSVEFQTQVAALKAQLIEVSQIAKVSLKEASEGIKGAADFTKPLGGKDTKASSQFNKAMTQAMRELQKESKDAEKAANSLDKELRTKPADANAVGGAFSKLGDVSKYIFGTILGVTAVSALRDVIRWFGDAVQSGQEFAVSIFKLVSSVHALQRVGFDITIKDTTELIDALGKRFSMFSNKELVDGVAQVQLLTRSFGFTKEQMQQTFEVAATISTVLGKDFNDAARETALFLSSGYAESMQKAGLAVNRFTVEQEGARLGLGKNYRAMTEQGRATAALSLVYREIKPLVGEVTSYEDTEVGQLKKMTAEYENVKNVIGLKLLPVKVALIKLLIQAFDALQNLNGIMIVVKDTIVSSLILPVIMAANVWSQFTQGTYDFGAAIQNTIKQVADLRTAMVSADLKKSGIGLDMKDLVGGNDLPKGEWGSMPLLTPDQEEEQLKLIEKMTKDASKMIRDYQQDVAKAGRDLSIDMGQIDTGDLGSVLGQWDNFFSNQNNMTVDATEAQQAEWEKFFGTFGSIVNDGLDKAFGIWQDYYNKLDDIARKEQQSIVDENADYANSIADTNRKAQQDAADATKKYHDEEIKAEREFQEKMRRLKEQYLFDLEDALRERDALQVLRLMRKYQMDKRNAQIDYDLEAQSRKEAFQRELEDIRIQRERKLQELAIEHQRKLEEIRIQADREREEAARNRDQAMEQLKADLEKERNERVIKYQQELEDLKTRFGERLAEIMIGLADEEGMTKEKLDAIGKLYLDMFGKGGIVGLSYDELNIMTQNAVQMAQDALAQIQQMAQSASETAAQIAATTAQAQLNLSSLSQMQQANQLGYQPYGTTASQQNVVPVGIAGHALGGSEYANTPTMAMFGEAGPEIATFTPVSRFNTKNLGVPNAYLGDTMPGMTGGEAKTQVYIRLGPGLVAEIVDGAMNGVARIIEEQ